MDVLKIAIFAVVVVIIVLFGGQFLFPTPVAGYNCYLVQGSEITGNTIVVNDSSCNFSRENPPSKSFYVVSESNGVSPIQMESKMVFGYNCKDFLEEITPIEKGYMDAFFKGIDADVYYCKGSKGSNI